jgi:restriction endonuclease Mrr
MPIPDYQSLMLPVLQSAAQGEVKLGRNPFIPFFNLSECYRVKML